MRQTSYFSLTHLHFFNHHNFQLKSFDDKTSVFPTAICRDRSRYHWISFFTYTVSFINLKGLMIKRQYSPTPICRNRSRYHWIPFILIQVEQ